MSNALPLSATNLGSTQVGGTHYASDYQHWDFIEDNRRSYLVGYATKYVMRWDKTATPVKDLQKALSAIAKIRERFAAGTAKPCPYKMATSLDDFATANALPPGEKMVMALMMEWRTDRDLSMAADVVSTLMAAAKAKEGSAPKAVDKHPEFDRT